MSDTTTIDPDLRQQVVDTICELLPRVLKREVTERLGEHHAHGRPRHELHHRPGAACWSWRTTLEREISVEDMGRDNFETVGSLADYVAGNLLPEE